MGFRVRSIKGIMCRVIREFSRVNVGVILIIWYGNFPRCVEISINRE